MDGLSKGGMSFAKGNFGMDGGDGRGFWIWGWGFDTDGQDGWDFGFWRGMDSGLRRNDGKGGMAVKGEWR